MSARQSAESAGASGLRAKSAAFLDYLDQFCRSLPDRKLADLVASAGGPERVAVIAVDVIAGFCVEGPLASPRVGAIVPPIQALFEQAHACGIRRFAVLRDSHAPDALEFEQFGPHCIAGTPESALVRELAHLPFAGLFADAPKNATSAWVGSTRFGPWMEAQRADGVNTYVVLGDCTDLCVYQTAMPLRLGANARGERITVVVPEDCVQTYDLPVPAARQLGVLPHEGDLLHAVFLYHLQLNGVEVVRRFTP